MPSPRRAPLTLRLAALALLAGCSQGPDPAVSAGSVPARSAQPISAFPTATGVPDPGAGRGPGAPIGRDSGAITGACRQAADRVIAVRDRGELIREDEAASRLGSQGSIYSQRLESDRLGRLYERDRLVADCVQQNTRAAPVAPPEAPPAAPVPAPRRR